MSYLKLDLKWEENQTWNNYLRNVYMTCRNPWGLSNERLNYCKELSFDILGLPGLQFVHHIQNKKVWKNNYRIPSDDAEVDEQGKCSTV